MEKGASRSELLAMRSAPAGKYAPRGGSPGRNCGADTATFTTDSSGTGKLSRYYRREGTTKGYTGHIPNEEKQSGGLETSLKKYTIKGYTGHVPYQRFIIGRSLDSSTEPVIQIESDAKLEFNGGAVEQDFRAYAKHLDLLERYTHAVEELNSRGQTQEGLMGIIQSKLSARVSSAAEQVIATKLLFEEFDNNGDGVLDESEFRKCLEKLNIQFDDIQVLALFAYFDEANSGFVEWCHFAEHANVPNPKGGTAVLPKMIIQVHGKGREL